MASKKVSKQQVGATQRRGLSLPYNKNAYANFLTVIVM